LRRRLTHAGAERGAQPRALDAVAARRAVVVEDVADEGELVVDPQALVVEVPDELGVGLVGERERRRDVVAARLEGAARLIDVPRERHLASLALVHGAGVDGDEVAMRRLVRQPLDREQHEALALVEVDQCVVHHVLPRRRDAGHHGPRQ
jgi:hypothetical protein